jgi:hypothetical protein
MGEVKVECVSVLRGRLQPEHPLTTTLRKKKMNARPAKWATHASSVSFDCLERVSNLLSCGCVPVGSLPSGMWSTRLQIDTTEFVCHSQLMNGRNSAEEQRDAWRLRMREMNARDEAERRQREQARSPSERLEEAFSLFVLTVVDMHRRNITSEDPMPVDLPKRWRERMSR